MKVNISREDLYRQDFDDLVYEKSETSENELQSIIVEMLSRTYINHEAS